MYWVTEIQLLKLKPEFPCLFKNEEKKTPTTNQNPTLDDNIGAMI